MSIATSQNPDHHSYTPLVFDDGGFEHFYPDGSGPKLPFDAYHRLLELSELANTRIPLSVTSCFLDTDNLSRTGLAHPEADRLITFLQDNSDRIQVWNHGLTHMHDGSFCEFGRYDAEDVPADFQQQHLETSQQILELATSQRCSVFVPPSHCWTQDVTDRIAKECGLESIAIRQFEKTPFTYWRFRPGRAYIRSWEPSRHLNTMYRFGLGIPADTPKLTPHLALKARQYIKASNRLISYLIHRRWNGINRPHHFFAHIQNLAAPQSLKPWLSLIRRIGAAS